MTTLSRQPTGSAESGRPAAPCEVFPTWRRAQLEVGRLAREALLAPCVLRTTGFLRPELAERVTDWFTAKPTAPTDAVRRSYRALERETARLFEILRRAPSFGGLGVRVQHVHSESDPYRDAAELCAELREHGSMTLTTIACDEPHPLLGGEEGGGVDKLRVVHDVFGHAALGVGFDLQSEFATWLQCRALFSDDARRAAFCEFVGAVTTYIMTGEKPTLSADLPPTELVAACDVDATRTARSRRCWNRVRRTRGNSSPVPAVTSAANVASASGFLLKDTGPAELIAAARDVASGEGALSPSVARRPMDEFATLAERKHPRPERLNELTPRELEVVALVASGMSDLEIAGRLVVSPATAKTHVSRALCKLNAHDRAQLVTLAYESGLVVPCHQTYPGPTPKE